MKKTSMILITFLLVVPTMVQAALVTIQPAGTPTVLTTDTGVAHVGSSSTVIAGGFTVSASSGSVVWYGDGGGGYSYSLSGNGMWENFAWVGSNYNPRLPAPTFTIALGGGYSAVGGFMNYATNSDAGLGAPYNAPYPLIEAIAADGTTVLESHDLFTEALIATPSGINAGAFRGFSRSTADIFYFRFSGADLIMHDLTLGGGTPVPEPGTMLLLGSGLVGLVGYGRRRFKK